MISLVTKDISRWEFTLNGGSRIANFEEWMRGLQEALPEGTHEDRIVRIAFLGCQRVLTPLGDYLGRIGSFNADENAGTSRFQVDTSKRTVTVVANTVGTLKKMDDAFRTVIGNGRADLTTTSVYDLANGDFTITATVRIFDMKEV